MLDARAAGAESNGLGLITCWLERYEARRGEARREGWKQVCTVMQIAK